MLDLEATEQTVEDLILQAEGSLKGQEISDAWARMAAATPHVLLGALLSDPVAEALRKELWRGAHRRIESAVLASLIHLKLVGSEVLGG